MALATSGGNVSSAGVFFVPAFISFIDSLTLLSGPGHSPGPVSLHALVLDGSERDAAVQGLQIQPERKPLAVGVRPGDPDGLPVRVPVLAPVTDPVRDVRRPSRLALALLVLGLGLFLLLLWFHVFS